LHARGTGYVTWTATGEGVTILAKTTARSLLPGADQSVTNIEVALLAAVIGAVAGYSLTMTGFWWERKRRKSQVLQLLERQLIYLPAGPPNRINGHLWTLATVGHVTSARLLLDSNLLSIPTDRTLMDALAFWLELDEGYNSLVPTVNQVLACQDVDPTWSDLWTRNAYAVFEKLHAHRMVLLKILDDSYGIRTPIKPVPRID
jgi:hypothetical protein